MSGKLLLGTLGALSLFAAAQQAQAVTLASLLGGGTLNAGGLTYSNFEVSGAMPASSVNVNTTSTGIQFTSGWDTVTGLDQTVVQFDVTSSNGDITGTTLNMSGSTILLNAAASVGETVTDLGTGNQYQLQVFDGGNGNPNNSFTDSATFTPAVTSIHVLKSIDVAAAPNGAASLNFVENIFTGPGTGETPPGVPEPMSLALLPLALAGMALRKKLTA